MGTQEAVVERRDRTSRGLRFSELRAERMRAVAPAVESWDTQ